MSADAAGLLDVLRGCGAAVARVVRPLAAGAALGVCLTTCGALRGSSS